MRYTQEELNVVLSKHQAWLNGETGGVRANLEGANLKGRSLRGADLKYAILKNANLRDANLLGASLVCANLKCANLKCADLKYTILRNAILGYADLEYTDLGYANLEGTNLEGANLQNVRLWGTTGNSLEIKSLQIETYPITYTSDRLQIGCEDHTITDWWEFTDERILQMDDRAALTFWRKWKEYIMMTIEMSPAINSTESR